MKNTTKRRTLLALVSLLIVACMTLLALPAYATGTGNEGWSVWDGTTVDTEFAGAGTPENPWLITSAAELAGLARLVVKGDAGGWGGKTYGGLSNIRMSKCYKLTVDIDLGGHEWLPIGVQRRIWEGVFDGNGHTVKNFKITKSAFTEADEAVYGDKCYYTNTDGTKTYLGIAAHAALFGNVGGQCQNQYNVAMIKNLTVTDANLNGGKCAGILAIAAPQKEKAEYDSVIIDNCHVSNITANSTETAAGIVAATSASKYGYFSVTNCTVSNTILNATTYVGGIAGYFYNGNSLTVKNCRSSANIYDGKTVNGVEYANKNVNDIGGIVGQVTGGLDIENCIYTGTIDIVESDSNFNVGGIVGDSCNYTISTNVFMESNRNVKNCVFTGKISAKSTTASGNNEIAVGGIAGKYMNGATIRNCAMYGSVDLDISESITHRSGTFAGAFGWSANGATQKSAISGSVCLVPAGTNTDMRLTQSVSNSKGTNLYPIGGSPLNDPSRMAIDATSVTVISPSTADIAMSLTGIQTSENPFDYDHDKKSETPTVKATDIRFVAALGDSTSDDDADLLSRYSAVGFVITATYGTKVFDFSQDVNHVYESILAKGEAVAASVYGGDYLVTITGRNIPASETDTVTFYVTPKLTTISGDVVYGATTALTFVGGVYQGGN